MYRRVASMIRRCADLLAHLRERGDGRWLLGLNGGVELVGGDVGDADGLDLLMLRDASAFRDLPLRHLGVGALTKLPIAAPALRIELLEQLAHAADRAGLDAIG